jgi:hypothetical protein
VHSLIQKLNEKSMKIPGETEKARVLTNLIEAKKRK